ncbi:MAG: SH3 domain-containing protein [Deltaproteobacteria bacterium]|nr:MAG: SH3 domain-containing protein [Deltaproteobacteria bacterium]
MRDTARSQRRFSGRDRHRRVAPERFAVAALVVGSLFAGCSQVPVGNPFGQARLEAQAKRAELLALEVTRLRADLEQAEKVLSGSSAGDSSPHSRADAIATIAEARITLERAADRARWGADEVAEARAKLAEADRQVELGHFGAAIFFAARAHHIANDLNAEVELVQQETATAVVVGERVNLRAGTSTDDRVVRVLARDTPVFAEAEDADWVLVRTAGGDVGWVHGSLIQKLR